MFKGIEKDAFVPGKKKLKLIVINSEIHVKEKARQAKLNAIANCFEKGKNRQFLKGHCHQFLMICKSKEKTISGR